MKRVLVTVGVLAACRTDDPTVTATNALVAPENASKLQFERRELSAAPNKYVRNVRFSLPWPKDWNHKDLQLAEAESSDGVSSILLESSCGGLGAPCLRENWNSVIDRDLEHVRDYVVRDERLANRRIVVYRLTTPVYRDPILHIGVYWWEDDGDEYFTCNVALGPEFDASAAAFEKACMSAKVVSISASQ